MEDAHIGVVDVCEHFGVELCSGCGIGGGAGGIGGARSRGERERRGAAAGGSGGSGGSSSSSGLSFFGVFDGHGGGGAAAAFAASRLLDLVVAPGREALAADPEAAMSAAFGRLDLEFYKYAIANAEAAEEESGRGVAGGREEAAEEEVAAAEETGRSGETSGGAAASSSSAVATLCPDPIHDCGSTALAALLCGTTLVLANAGDSRAVLCSRTGGGGRGVARSEKESSSTGNGNGTEPANAGSTPPFQPQPPLSQPSSSTSTFRQLTVDHKPSLASEKARIEAAGGRVCPEGFLNSCLGVARAIGDFSPSDGLKWLSADGDSFLGPLTSIPDVVSHEVSRDDEFLLVACDGLWDVLPTARAVELARQHLRSERGDPGKAAEALVRHALSLHASDNVTALLLCFGPQQQGPESSSYDEASAAAAAAAAAAPRPLSPRPIAPSASSTSRARPARSLSRNSLSTLSDALASCERGGGATGTGRGSGGPTATAAAGAAALLLPPLAPPHPAVVVVAGGGGNGGGEGGARGVVPSSPAFLVSGGRSRSQQSEGDEAGSVVGGRPPRPAPNVASAAPDR